MCFIQVDIIELGDVFRQGLGYILLKGVQYE
jgi:hypothetical protein